ncbi:DUF1178 family protein [Azospirillum brasilense]|uniref:DUF1178 family protein n=1 Tax=Azospirillum brasilense TaxID=192 RepID=A0A6L3B455_AZOBR|nr:DUF1178 family protein [Azospirillum brasilense]KAA0686961.1 DUF1178 family protein [Azospirillum brasilense]
MILFVLKCTADHRFEAWFRNGDAYETQAAARAIACPVCGDTHIAKAPMAPRIAKGGRSKDDAPRESGAPEAVPTAAGGAPAPAAPPASATPTVPAEVRERFAAEVMRQLTEIRRTVEESCDYVGDRFAEEARRIHYGETDPRGIYGEATDKEADELKEEGVTFGRIPWLPRTNS